MTTTSGQKVQPESALVWRAIHLGFVAMFGLGAFVHIGFALGNGRSPTQPCSTGSTTAGRTFSWPTPGCGRCSSAPANC